jgi:hypothetical protein
MRKFGPNGNELVILVDENTIKLDYDENGNMIYSGKAPVGSLTSTAIWQIQKSIYNGNNYLVAILWANGDANFDNVWDDRASLTYS